MPTFSAQAWPATADARTIANFNAYPGISSCSGSSIGDYGASLIVAAALEGSHGDPFEKEIETRAGNKRLTRPASKLPNSKDIHAKKVLFRNPQESDWLRRPKYKVKGDDVERSSKQQQDPPSGAVMGMAAGSCV